MYTNIKLVTGGTNLVLDTKIIKVDGETLNANQMQAVCSKICNRFGIAATPYGNNTILVEYSENVPSTSFSVEGDWIVKILTTQIKQKLDLSDVSHKKPICDLYKRSIQINANRLDSIGKIDSPRILWKTTPMITPSVNVKGKVWSDIQAFRRYEISDIFLEEVGLGFSIDVSTAFVTSWSVLDYFSTGNVRRFEELSSRQNEHKGTLIYHGPNGKVKCYFEKFDSRKTLLDTPAFSIGKNNFKNSYEYYSKMHPSYPVNDGDKVVLVSFPGMGSKYVPAKQVYLRVMNNNLDRELSQIDKIDPYQRDLLIKEFWRSIGDHPFGPKYSSVEPEMLQFGPKNSGLIPLPKLAFGAGKTLEAPRYPNKDSYRKHFRSRKELLDKHGCYFTSPSTQAKLHIVFDEQLPEDLVNKFEGDFRSKVSKLIGKDVEVEAMFCNHYLEATSELNRYDESGIVLFIFNDSQPATYHNIAFELKNWQVKRITVKTLSRLYKQLIAPKPGKEEITARNWQSFIDMNAYALLQAFHCVPYSLSTAMKYDAQLVIDVSDKHHYFALSLFIHSLGKVPILDGFVVHKADYQKESINPAFLTHHLKELFKEKGPIFKRYNVKSLLVLRDGQDFKDEYKAVKKAIDASIEASILDQEFRYDFVEYHKSTQKKIRLWERDSGKVLNVLEGSYIILDKQTAVLNTTGAGTVTQGTAEPILLKAATDCDIKAVINDVFLSSQLNFASPSVAQKLTVAAQRADELLQEKMSMEIIRIS